ncbi:MAG: tyrosine-type recombinase/integrase [Bacilli bacterium]|nr:tyrosine-type recombinase/integrase [Bacilli bacterium]
MQEHHEISSILPLYVEEMRKRLKPSTAHLWKENIELHLLPYFQGKHAETITNEDLEAYNEKINKELRPGALKSTVSAGKKFIVFLRRFNPNLDAGRLFRYVDPNPHPVIYHFYTIEEEKRFLSVIKNRQDQLIFRLFVYYGLRLGELLGLKRRDFDERCNTLSIERSRAEKVLEGNSHIQSPKTKRSIRTLLLLPGLKELLDPTLEPEDFLFQSKVKEGSFINEMTIRRRAKKYARKAGLIPIKIHEFRHSCASNLLRAGIPLRVVASWLGDKETTILTYYSHMFLDEVAVVEKFFVRDFELF